jgi:endonuclease III
MTKTLTELSDQELQAELQRRAHAAEQARVTARRQKFALLMQHRDALLALVPHGRTSCSDEKPVNGFSYYGQTPRCTRCALLELSEFTADNYDVQFGLAFSPLDA